MVVDKVCRRGSLTAETRLVRRCFGFPFVAVLARAVAFCLLFTAATGFSAVFPGNADLTVSDPNGILSWNAAANALTVQCWFKMSVPSGTNLTNNMAIVVNQASGSDGGSSPGAFLFRFNIYNGNVEFVTQGSSGGYTNTLIQQPYLAQVSVPTIDTLVSLVTLP